ncbi:MAG TPA: hypothetical protein ENK33_06690, partial [Desulfobacterales bacterium]|nr:hypothetical protein [Desulfobacterales bacterium]
MMNLSKVIKTSPPGTVAPDILTSRPGLAELEQEKFQSFDSLWRDDRQEIVDAMTILRREREETKKHCAAMVAEAESRVAEIEQEARDRGFAAGREEAKEAGKVELHRKSGRIDELLNLISKERGELYAEYQKGVELIVQALLERILFHEVSVNPRVIVACLKAALGYVVENSNVTVHLHPNDLERLKESGLDDPELLVRVKNLEMVDDPLISEGGCLLETDFGEVDATLELRREKLNKAIGVMFQYAVDHEQDEPPSA